MLKAESFSLSTTAIPCCEVPPHRAPAAGGVADTYQEVSTVEDATTDDDNRDAIARHRRMIAIVEAYGRPTGALEAIVAEVTPVLVSTCGETTLRLVPFPVRVAEAYGTN
jgi:hypothetical protein